MNLDSHLDTILRRHGELGARLAAGAAGSDYADASREYAELEPLAGAIRGLRAKQRERADLDAMLADPALEADMREIAAAEIEEAGAAIEATMQEIRVALLPKDAADESNVILEVRADVLALLEQRGDCDSLREPLREIAERHDVRL